MISWVRTEVGTGVGLNWGDGVGLGGAGVFVGIAAGVGVSVGDGVKVLVAVSVAVGVAVLCGGWDLAAAGTVGKGVRVGGSVGDGRGVGLDVSVTVAGKAVEPTVARPAAAAGLAPQLTRVLRLNISSTKTAHVGILRRLGPVRLGCDECSSVIGYRDS